MTQASLFNDTDTQNGLTARKVAAQILDKILTRRTPMDQVLDSSAEFAALQPRDRAFVRMLVTTTLRYLGQVDDLIKRASTNPTPPEPPILRHILRLGVVQGHWMNVPDHAVVNTMVDLCAVMNLGRAKGLVNAVLRRVLSEGKDWIANQDAARINLPDWLIRDWATDYDLRTAADMALAAQSAAMLDITLKDPSQTAYWAQQLEAELLPTGSLRRAAGGHISDLPGFAEGAWWVQDAAAAIPVLLMGDIADKNVADLCAAPGGKTAQLAARGARVHALDRAATRLKRLQENMDRLTLADRVTVEAGDAVQWQPQKKFDAVLIDAPCSATGTLRRHPDVAHLKTPEDIDRLCTMQAAILDNAATLLVPGGVMVYCTCSLQKAEGERQIDAFLARHPDFSRQPITADALGGLGQAITKDGDVRILPQFWSERGGMDGFYIARLTRQE